MVVAPRRLIGLMGGTFDPIHYGHIYSALQLNQRLQLDELRLLPCHCPPHRAKPLASAEHRLMMIKQALAPYPGLTVDERELYRPGPSYTVDTLTELHAEQGDTVAFCLVMGSDAFTQFDRWHNWQRIMQLAHIVVINRPNSALPKTGAVAALAASHALREATQLRTQAAGGVWFVTLQQYAISATAIRRALANGEQVSDKLLPAAVLRYISAHNLYCRSL